MSKSKKARRARYVIAIDLPYGVYLRRTLNVTHHGETGEVQYDSKPAKPSSAPLKVQIAFRSVQQITGLKNRPRD